MRPRPQDLRRSAAVSAAAANCQRRAGIPAPVSGKHRRIQQRLDQHLARARRLEELRNVTQRKAVRWPQREDDRILQRCRLQLEVEATAKALAQRQAPGAIDA